MKGRLKDVIKARRAMPELLCSICIFVRDEGVEVAATIINGQAVCNSHLGHVQGGQHALSVRTAMEFKKR